MAQKFLKKFEFIKNEDKYLDGCKNNMFTIVGTENVKTYCIDQKKGKLTIIAKDKGNGNIIIKAKEDAYFAGGKDGKKELNVKCDPAKWSVEGKNPAYEKDPIVPVDDKVGCLHAIVPDKSPLGLPSDLQTPNLAGLTPASTGYKGTGVFTWIGPAGLKVEGKVKAGLVKNVKIQDGSKKVCVVGDTIELKDHKFKGIDDVQETALSTMLKMTFLWQGVPLGSTALVQSVDLNNLLPIGDAPKDTVKNSITNSGSSTSVYCERKLIALKDNNNVCKNDSKAELPCLKIK